MNFIEEKAEKQLINVILNVLNISNLNNNQIIICNAKIIIKEKTIPCEFVISKNFQEPYKSYLEINKRSFSFKNQGISSKININDIPTCYKLKIFLKNYIINIYKIQINANFSFSLENCFDKKISLDYKMLINKNNEIFSVVNIKNKYKIDINKSKFLK